MSKFTFWQCGYFYAIIISSPIRRESFKGFIFTKGPDLIRPKSIFTEVFLVRIVKSFHSPGFPCQCSRVNFALFKLVLQIFFLVRTNSSHFYSFFGKIRIKFSFSYMFFNIFISYS